MTRNKGLDEVWSLAFQAAAGPRATLKPKKRRSAKLCAMVADALVSALTERVNSGFFGADTDGILGAAWCEFFECSISQRNIVGSIAFADAGLEALLDAKHAQESKDGDDPDQVGVRINSEERLGGQIISLVERRARSRDKAD